MVSSKLLGSLCEGHGTCWGSLDRVATDIISSGGLWGRQPEPHQGVFVQPPRGVVVVVFAVVVVARCRGSTVASLSKPPLHVQGIRDQDVYVHHGERETLSLSLFLLSYRDPSIVLARTLSLLRSRVPFSPLSRFYAHFYRLPRSSFLRVLLSLCPYLHPCPAQRVRPKFVSLSPFY